jgi:hypothetical protein
VEINDIKGGILQRTHTNEPILGVYYWCYRPIGGAYSVLVDVNGNNVIVNDRKRWKW